MLKKLMEISIEENTERLNFLTYLHVNFATYIRCSLYLEIQLPSLLLPLWEISSIGAFEDTLPAPSKITPLLIATFRNLLLTCVRIWYLFLHFKILCTVRNNLLVKFNFICLKQSSRNQIYYTCKCSKNGGEVLS